MLAPRSLLAAATMLTAREVRDYFLYTVYMTMYMTHETPTTRTRKHASPGRRSQSTGSTDSESESAGDEAPGGGTRLLLGCGIGRARFRLPPEPPEVEPLALLPVRVPLVPALFCSRRACAAAALARGVRRECCVGHIACSAVPREEETAV